MSVQRSHPRSNSGGPMPDFKNNNYVEVAERIVECREKYPSGSLGPANPDKPYSIETVGDRTFIVVVAAFHRTPDDPRPGIGMAWEPFPGKTNFTRDSELQNAETSAWGRALVAALAADTKRGIASADEVRARSAAKPARAAQPEPSEPVATTRMSRTSRPAGGATPSGGITDKQLGMLQSLMSQKGFVDRDDRLAFASSVLDRSVASSKDLTAQEASRVIDALQIVED